MQLWAPHAATYPAWARCRGAAGALSVLTETQMLSHHGQLPISGQCTQAMQRGGGEGVLLPGPSKAQAGCQAELLQRLQAGQGQHLYAGQSWAHLSSDRAGQSAKRYTQREAQLRAEGAEVASAQSEPGANNLGPGACSAGSPCGAAIAAGYCDAHQSGEAVPTRDSDPPAALLSGTLPPRQPRAGCQRLLQSPLPPVIAPS